jgi:hypothetical protein
MTACILTVALATIVPVLMLDAQSFTTAESVQEKVYTNTQHLVSIDQQIALLESIDRDLAARIDYMDRYGARYSSEALALLKQRQDQQDVKLNALWGLLGALALGLTSKVIYDYVVVPKRGARGPRGERGSTGVEPDA